MINKMMKTMINTITNKDSIDSIVDYKAIKTQTSSKELNLNIKTAIKLAHEYASKKEYRFKQGELVLENPIVFGDLKESNLSNNRRKKIAKYLAFFLSKPTAKKFNKLFNILWKNNEIETVPKIKMVYGVKEDAIVSKRKLFKDLLKQMLLAKQDYLVEKGDFYK